MQSFDFKGLGKVVISPNYMVVYFAYKIHNEILSLMLFHKDNTISLYCNLN